MTAQVGAGHTVRHDLIPGPNSTELAIHIGYRRAGWGGLLAAGAAFILPATLIVMGVSWVYVTYGALPDVRAVMAGIAPVVIAIVAHGLWGMGRAVLKTPALGLLALGALISARGFCGETRLAH